MPSILPILLFILVFLIFQRKHGTLAWRDSFLSASVIWGFLLTAITEFLNLFRLIDFWHILALWILSVLVGLILLLRTRGNTKAINLRLNLPGFSGFELLLTTGIVLVILIIGLIGLFSPPNSYDSMTYHMSRVIHWIQNKSIEYYPTHILRQLHSNPWAEYAITHFQILSGSDHFANLVQWFSMIGSTLGVSLLAKKLGANLRGQLFSSAISITIPMGILQASSTQNDYAVSFWLVCFTYFAFHLREKGTSTDSLTVGVSLGLAILTKATAYIYAFPIIVWVGLSLIKTYRAKGVQMLALVAILAVAINVGHYARNYNLYGGPLGPNQEEGGFKYSNDVFSVSSAISNVIRNIGLHLSTPNGYVNHILEKQIRQLHQVIGIDLNDARTTWPGTEFKILDLSLSEDDAGDLLHLFSILVSTPILIFVSRKRKNIFSYFACLVSAFLLFSIYLKWQPWHSRLQLPLFVLWSPLVGVLLSEIKQHWLANLCCGVLFLGAIPYLLYSESRPLVGQESILFNSRTDLYFEYSPFLNKPYVASARLLSRVQCSNIGLVLGPDDWEYPLWVLLSHNGKQKVRLEHVNVTNISQRKYSEYPFNTFIPCAVIVLSENPPNEIQMESVTYVQKRFFYPVSVYIQK